jgi:hypothetical protein
MYSQSSSSFPDDPDFDVFPSSPVRIETGRKRDFSFEIKNKTPIVYDYSPDTCGELHSPDLVTNGLTPSTQPSMTPVVIDTGNVGEILKLYF